MLLMISNRIILYVIIPGIILVIAILINALSRFLFNRFINKSAKHLNVDKTTYNFLKNALSTIVLMTAFMLIIYVIPELRSLGLTLFAGAGVFAAFIGLASQQAFSNIVSGIFIVIFKPFRVGDYVYIGEKYSGFIEDITLRHTIIKNYENKRIVIPNSSISSETIVNSTLGNEEICVFLEIGIGYDSDIDKAINIIRDEAESHPDLLDKRTEEEISNNIEKVIIRVIGYGDSSINLRAYIWAKNQQTAFVMKCDLYKSIKYKFDKEGVEIPYPYRTVVLKNKN